MNQTFEVEWFLDDDGWAVIDNFDRENDPGSEFDTTGMAFYWSPSGHFQMRHGDQVLFLDEMRIAPLWAEYLHEHWVARVTHRERGFDLPQFGLLPIAATLANGVDTDWFRIAPPIVFDVFLSDGEPPNYFLIRKLPWLDEVIVQHRVRHITLPSPEHGSSRDEWWPDLEMDDVASKPLQVPEDEFIRGVQRYLSQLFSEIFERHPKLREWQSFEPFLRYVDG